MTTTHALTAPPLDVVAPTAAARGTKMQTLYAELQREVQALGLLRRRYGYYGVKLAAAPVVLAGFVAAIVLLGDTWWQLGVAAALGIALAQIAFLGHEAAHRQIFASGPSSDWAAMSMTNLMSGMSYSWWATKHTKHHGSPNKLGKDGDIESDILAYHPDAVAGRPRLGAWLARHQGYYFFGLITLQGWAMHVNSLKHLLGAPKVRRRRVELALVALRLGAYLALLVAVLPLPIAAAFLVVQVGVFGTYLALAFAPNHIGMPLVPKGMTLDFLRRQVLMSRNIRGGRFMEVLLGGLNHQIEHHLFPTMSRPDLRRVKPLVREFCARHGITYTETGLFQSYGSIARYLNRVGLGSRDVFVCPLVQQYRAVA